MMYGMIKSRVIARQFTSIPNVLNNTWDYKMLIEQ